MLQGAGLGFERRRSPQRDRLAGRNRLPARRRSPPPRRRSRSRCAPVHSHAHRSCWQQLPHLLGAKLMGALATQRFDNAIPANLHLSGSPGSLLGFLQQTAWTA